MAVNRENRENRENTKENRETLSQDQEISEENQEMFPQGLGDPPSHPPKLNIFNFRPLGGLGGRAGGESPSHWDGVS